MVSRNDLLKDDVACVEKAKKVAVQIEKDRKKFAQEMLVKNTACAEMLLDNELGELLKKMNRGTSFFNKKENGSIIAITQYKVWCRNKLGDKEGWIETYEDFDLSFVPEPNYKPTKILLSKLKKAGFKAKIETIEFDNLEYFVTADGYDARKIPGTHPEYYLVIEW